MYPHPIRLRGPWQVEPAGGGRVRYRRRFGWPARLDAHERVWLVVGPGGPAEVWLNGQQLGRREAGQSFEVDVTALARVRNEVVIEAEAAGEVGLEVRCTAFPRDLRACHDHGTGRLHVRGKLVGTSDQPLECYVLAGGSTVIYATTEPAPEGRPFHLVSDPLEARPEKVRVEFVNVATVWYAAEVPVNDGHLRA